MTTTSLLRPIIRVYKRDFLRALTMYCCKDGTISYAPRGDEDAKPISAAVPVFSVENEEEARALIINFCAQSRTEPGRYHYSLADYQYQPEDLAFVYQTLKDAYSGDTHKAHQHAQARARMVYGSEFGRVRTPYDDDDDPAATFRQVHQLEQWMERIGGNRAQRIIPKAG